MQDTIIITPTLNEAEGIEAHIRSIFGACPDCHALIVDDNSRDKTQEIVRALTSEFPRLHLLERARDHGYGKSILAGLAWAQKNNYERVISMDSDGSHPYSALKQMLGGLDTCDFVIGSRYVALGGVKDWAWHRILLSRYANLYVRLILGLPIGDMTSGFVAYSRRATEMLTAASTQGRGYAFLVETKYALARAGLRACEVPIIFSDRREGQSKMSSRKIWESIWLPWKLKFSRR